ncbi:hypothetical protein [Endozoicomonas sp. ONNA2]|uniref:hypothetical protein n=1 Tax=Endozoicomonas sp. ONNA2 TaxID=2828741 RepID=UPI00214774C2|nr:hypothetical protein [Endozoicomonas sp. ONNA2]
MPASCTAWVGKQCPAICFGSKVLFKNSATWGKPAILGQPPGEFPQDARQSQFSGAADP